MDIKNLKFGDITKYEKGKDVIHYEWTINGKILTFYDFCNILYQDRFRQICFRALLILPYKVTEKEWVNIINAATLGSKTVIIEEKPYVHVDMDY